jgi:beta-phosphoglucomutase-like phosphatase (HAD superfamily)
MSIKAVIFDLDGVKAAKAAGTKVIAFDSPNTHGRDLSMTDAVVDDLGEVRKHLRLNFFPHNYNHDLQLQILRPGIPGLQ